jgi:hypothetical protein
MRSEGGSAAHRAARTDPHRVHPGEAGAVAGGQALLVGAPLEHTERVGGDQLVAQPDPGVGRQQIDRRLVEAGAVGRGLGRHDHAQHRDQGGEAGGRLVRQGVRYLWADYCDGEIHTLLRRPDGRVEDRGTGLRTPDGDLESGGSITSFGQDGDGELYVTSADGGVYLIQAV